MFENIKTKKLSTAISMLTLFETIGTLTGREKWGVEKTIGKISEIRNEIKSEVLDFKGEDMLEKAFENWKKYRQCGFFDCCHYLIMKTSGITEIYAIDPHFDSFPDIRRVAGESEIS